MSAHTAMLAVFLSVFARDLITQLCADFDDIHSTWN